MVQNMCNWVLEGEQKKFEDIMAKTFTNLLKTIKLYSQKLNTSPKQYMHTPTPNTHRKRERVMRARWNHIEESKHKDKILKIEKKDIFHRGTKICTKGFL